jgi:protein-S-isoprenylcysteine O-methyltransferase Ste14
MIVLATIQFNKNLYPFPTFKYKSILIQNGLYKYCRRFIYIGIVLFVLGGNFYLVSVYNLIISILLFVLFCFKSAYEEILLHDKFPTYSIYKQKTTRFFKFFY